MNAFVETCRNRFPGYCFDFILQCCKAVFGYYQLVFSSVALFVGGFKCKAQILIVEWLLDCTFLFVHLQVQLGCDKAGNVSHYSVCRPGSFKENAEVVGVPYKTQTSICQFLVQFVQYDIGK